MGYIKEKNQGISCCKCGKETGIKKSDLKKDEEPFCSLCFNQFEKENLSTTPILIRFI